jgi:hypothetical protein
MQDFMYSDSPNLILFMVHRHFFETMINTPWSDSINTNPFQGLFEFVLLLLLLS